MKKQKDIQSDSENTHLIDEKSLLEQLLELKKAYKASDKTIKKVEEIFLQGDYRYTDVWNNIIVAGFIDNGAIKIDKIEEKIIKKPNKEEIDEIKNPQRAFKFYAKQIAEERGFIIKEYEPSVCGGKGDILAVNRNKELIIECCSCRINKAIDYLSRPKTILWVLLRHIAGDKITIFQLSRGKNWIEFNDNHENYMMDKMRQAIEKLSNNFSSKKQTL